MAVVVIDTIKPKNQGTFPIVEAADVKVTNDKRLDTALNEKASQSDMTAVQTAVAGKASQADLTALTNTVSGKASQSDLTALSNTVADKADKSALAETNAAVASKQAALTESQLTAVNSGITSSLVTQIGTNTTAIAGKASQADLTALETEVYTKADADDLTTATANLQSQIDAIVSPVTEDAEVQNARVDARGVSHTTLKARCDSDTAYTESEFNEIRTIYKPINLLNKNDSRIISNKYIVGDNLTDLNGACVSHPIYLERNKTYTFSINKAFFGSTNSLLIHPISEDGTTLQSVAYYATDNNDGTATFTVTSQSKYYAFNIKASDIGSVMFVEGSELPSTYQPYFEEYVKIKESALPDAFDQIDVNTAAIAELDDDLDEIRTKYTALNYFNKNNSKIIDSKYIVGDSFDDLNGASVSHPIYLEAGKTYTFTADAMFGSTNNRLIHPINAEGTTLTGSALYATDNNNGSATIAIRTSDYYAFNVKSSGKSTTMLVEGTELPSTYQPYFEPYTEINPAVIPRNMANNPLYGKSISWTGDSIAYGAGYEGGYPKIIALNNAMTSRNIAVSGGTIRNIDGHFDIGASIANMTVSDYNILEGGVNDASLHSSGALGSLTNDYLGNFDTSTFYGAFEKMLSDAVVKFKGKKLGYIMVHACVLRFSAWWVADNGYYQAAKKCCQKWGVPFLDLSETVPPFGLLTTGAEALQVLPNTYTHNGDGWHPNEDGYKKYYVSKIEEWLKTL